MRRPATRLGGAGRVQGGPVLVDVEDLAIHPDDERHPVGYSRRLVQDAILPRYFPFREIAQERHGDVVLETEFFLGRKIIGTDAKYLGVGLAEFRNTSLVCLEFGRSTTGERGGIERQYYGVLAAEFGEGDFLAFGRGQGEIGRLVSDA